MKNLICLLTLFLLVAGAAYAQSGYAIKGAAVDSTEKKQLLNATIMVLNAKDSILQKFTRAGADGTFSINDLSPGAHILWVSYPGYADYTETFLLTAEKKEYNFGRISMELKSKLLHDVIIKGEAVAIKIKGDTTEFNAKAYVIQPNDKVEDLIKQFPGIQVDKDGKITAQGKTVEKVLVDGEEFFGDDPTLVTKNVRADMVDKVQLYDKKSDQATFTGIDDGVKTKTLNIKLKENKKNGYFGKADAGIGTDKYYQGQLLYNRFTAKQKFSLYSINGNTGKTGLGWQDSQKYGDGAGVTVDDNGGISLFFNGDDGLDSFNGQYNGQGIPRATTGGMHYDTKWNKDNQTLNANYKAGELDINGVRGSITINNIPDNVISTTSDQTFKNSMFRQKLDLTYLVKFDTTSTLKISVDGTYKHGTSNNNSSSFSNRNDTLLNRSSRTVTNANDEHIFNASAFYTKKLKKKGRTISLLVSTAMDNNDAKGHLNTQTTFYNPHTGAVDSTQKVDQLKTNTSKNTIFNTNLTYTEPLTKALSLIINYGVNVNNGSSDRRSYNKSPSGVYNVLDSTVSNYFKLDQLSNTAGIMLNYKTPKSLINFGSKASDVSFKQIDEYTGDIFKRHFINWNPQANYQYRFSQQQSLYINYNGNTQQPSINQIQPVKVNTDPLNIFLGNAKLTPSFSNRFNLSYYSYKVLTDQNLYFGGSYSITSNQIVNSTVTNNVGKSVIQYVNLQGKTPSSLNLYGNYGRKVKAIGMSVGINFSANAYKNYAYTDNVLTPSNSGVYSIGLNVNKYVKDKYDFYFNFSPTYNVSESYTKLKGSLQLIDNNSHGFQSYGGFNIYLPAKFQLSSNINYTYTGKTQTFDTDQVKAIWNATLSKAFFKEKNLKFSVSGNDLLNQNIGFYRSTNGNIISQNTYTSIKRYFMFSVTWDFNKMGGPTK